MLRIALALCALFAATCDATAGPIRDRIREARPGILIPKRAAAGCGASCAPCQSAPQAYSSPQLVTQAGYTCSGGSCGAPAFAPSYPQYLPSYYAPQSCPGGRCPLPR